MILHLVTDRRKSGATSFRAERDCLLRQTAFAVEAGVDLIQLREGDLAARELCTLVADILKQAQGGRTRVIVNDRVDVALAAGAHGVHLRGDSMPPQAVRSIVPAGFLVGRSVHSAAEVLEGNDSADYLIAGTVWPSRSKHPGHSLLGIEGLASIVKVATVPVLGIGGVTLDRLADLRATGASGAAAIDLFWPASASGDPCLAGRLVEVVKEARARFGGSR